MGTISRVSKAGGGTNFNSGQTIDPAEVNSDLNTIYTEFNGNISNANVLATAAIAASKISGLSFTRVGLLVAEQTTTSTTAVDLATIGSLSIPTTSWIFVYLVARKTAGAATSAGLGLKLNTTVVKEAVVGEFPVFTGTNEAQQTIGEILIPPPTTNYLRSGRLIGYRANTLAQATNASLLDFFTADHPNATITSLIIRGITTASVTLGVSNIVVFEGAMT